MKRPPHCARHVWNWLAVASHLHGSAYSVSMSREPLSFRRDTVTRAGQLTSNLVSQGCVRMHKCKALQRLQCSRSQTWPATVCLSIGRPEAPTATRNFTPFSSSMPWPHAAPPHILHALQPAGQLPLQVGKFCVQKRLQAATAHLKEGWNRCQL